MLLDRTHTRWAVLSGLLLAAAAPAPRVARQTAPVVTGRMASAEKAVSSRIEPRHASAVASRAERNEDMRIFPRCLDNPGPDSKGLTDVYANSCAKIPAQTWMISKPYQ